MSSPYGGLGRAPSYPCYIHVASRAGRLRLHGTRDELNEAFTSTSLADALSLGQKVIQRLLDRDLIGVYVTFVDVLVSVSPAAAGPSDRGESGRR